MLTPKIAKRWGEIIREVAKDLDITIFRMAVNEDHVHIFMRYPPKLSLSYMAMKLKSRSSTLLRREFPELKKAVRDHLWAPSAASNGYLQRLRRCRENQSSGARLVRIPHLDHIGLGEEGIVGYSKNFYTNSEVSI